MFPKNILGKSFFNVWQRLNEEEIKNEIKFCYKQWFRLVLIIKKFF